MMHVKTFFVILIVAIFFPILLSAQAQDWGKITEEELIMEGIPEDPEADAVILFNTCRIQIDHRGEYFELEIFYHKRIKIFTETGKDYANVEIPFLQEDKIFDLEANCYTPDGKKHKLDDDNIFEEKNINWKLKKFAIPAVEIGSIIEYKYQLYSKYIRRLRPWAFQENDFTKYSEITVLLPSGFTYNALPMNILIQDIDRTEHKTRDPYNSSLRCTKHTWIVRDKPGIKKEPHMKAFHDYFAQVLFQLVSYKSPRGVFRSFAKSWDEVSKDIRKFYKGKIGQDGGIEEFTKNLTNGITDPYKKVEIIYDYVRQEIKTAGTSYLWGERFREPKKLFKSKEGSTNEKNILLINMLNHACFKAQPLLISTRNNGAVYPEWETLQQFNRVIAHLQFDKKTYVLNTSYRFNPMGYLMPEYDVEIGLLFEDDNARIIKFKPRIIKNRREVETEASLSADGQLIAHSQLKYKGMNGIIERNRVATKDLDDYITESLQELHAEAILDSFHYSDIDSIRKPLVLDIYYHIPEFAEEADSLIYFTVPLLTGKKENEFVREKRSFPVDFEFEETISEKIKIELANCYQINEMPKKYKTRMRSLSFNKIYFKRANKIECNRSLKLSSKRFSEFEYPKIRQNYEKIVNSDQDQVVLVRKQ